MDKMTSANAIIQGLLNALDAIRREAAKNEPRIAFIDGTAEYAMQRADAIRLARLGTDAAQEVLIESRPDDPLPRWYRLEPHEFRFDWEGLR